jgi:hypothetical protein
MIGRSHWAARSEREQDPIRRSSDSSSGRQLLTASAPHRTQIGVAARCRPNDGEPPRLLHRRQSSSHAEMTARHQDGAPAGGQSATTALPQSVPLGTPVALPRMNRGAAPSRSEAPRKARPRVAESPLPVARPPGEGVRHRPSWYRPVGAALAPAARCFVGDGAARADRVGGRVPVRAGGYCAGFRARSSTASRVG